MKKWPAIYWAVAVAILALFISILCVISVHYKAANVQSYYIIWAILLSSWFYYKSRGCKEVHIHHYVIMMVLLSFTCYQDVFTTIISALFNGIMIEGASMYGYDPIFVHTHPREGSQQD